MNKEQVEEIICQNLSFMDPRGKKVLVLGGGDTAQDVIRWVARYFNHTESLSSLEVMVRGPEFEERGMMDAYPHPSRAPTAENHLKAEEVLYIQGKINHLVETQFIRELDDKLSVGISQSEYLHSNIIHQDQELKKIFDDLPRQDRRLDRNLSQNYQIDGVDMMICALGFQGRNSFELVKKLNRHNPQNVVYAGDASDASQQIIVGAQANAKNTYQGQIRKRLSLEKDVTQQSFFKESFRTPLVEPKAQRKWMALNL